MKLLREIINRLKPTKVVGSLDIEISSVQSDSRKAEANSLFIATCGTQVNGHNFIQSAIEKGATAIVCQEIKNITDGITYIQVVDSNEALGLCASAWHNNPSSKLTLVGVTGTNGKTTIATLLYKMFSNFGHKCGLLSTVCNYIGTEAVASTHTTPDPLSLNSLLCRMVDAGCEYAFMEVSSHSVDQKRIAGLEFNGGIFTNITRDHLDYHKTFSNYIDAKRKFFDSLSPSSFALTNEDDKNGLIMLQNTKASKHTYSLSTLSDFKGRIFENNFEGMMMEINGKEIWTSFVGKFNASNLLAVTGAAVLLGKNIDEALIQLSTLKPVSGRFETIRSSNGYTAIVDYAHTPDALKNVIDTINDIKCGGRLITVVGCGGNRDKGKRPIMAQEAANGSEQIIITSDNPRFEEPEDIINDMLAGLDNPQLKKTIAITDRKQAIKTACVMAQPGDVILVAGKGHENYQDIKGTKHHFDDKEVLTETMN